jgi:hypothetical protein
MTIYKTHVTVIMPAVSDDNIKLAITGIESIQKHSTSHHKTICFLDRIKRLLTPFATPLQR